MIKTQIQLPDALYRDLKRLAASREWSLEETMRRAAEQFLARHPVVTPPSSPWRPPVSDTVGWRGLSHEAVREAALDDLEARTVEAQREGLQRLRLRSGLEPGGVTGGPSHSDDAASASTRPGPAGRHEE